MTSPHETQPASASRDHDGEPPGVPGLRTWRGVYVFVFSCFVATVIALTIFSRVFA
ncbi:MAG: hypothetical protein NVV63_10915 [Opitutus sp.]|nr:hypothetical protein [Opitutus sp.]